jgi:apolipoprotein N-acyltransferase
VTDAAKADRAATVALTAFALGALLVLARDVLGLGAEALDWIRALVAIVFFAGFLSWMGFRLRANGRTAATAWPLALLLTSALVAASAALNYLLRG